MLYNSQTKQNIPALYYCSIIWLSIWPICTDIQQTSDENPASVNLLMNN